MNFFEHQDRARQNTQQLVGLFILSVIFIVTSIYFAAWFIFGITDQVQSLNAMARSTSASHSFIDPQLLMLVTVPTLSIIGCGSWYKLSQLQQGGRVIAQDLGGRLLVREGSSPAEDQLLNVVEEMAIAANIRVPPVYLLDREHGINAFAAGFTTKDAVIGVTRGAIEQLNRDELQGVIGHEFSHILNGDMRLNLRLVGWLNGLLLLYITGRVIFRWNSYGTSRNEKGSALMWFGLILIVFGSIGVLCGRLIQSAVSRQREFLADASAVQFTRNPDGIAQALRKIAGYQYDSRIQSPFAEANSHLFFGNARSPLFGSWFATHPPLDQRIRRIEGKSGTYTSPRFTAQPSPQTISETGNPQMMGFAAETAPLTARGSSRPGTDPATPAAGLPPLKWIAALPPAVQSTVQQPSEAIALIYALTLNPENAAIRDQQLAWLRQSAPENVVENASHLQTVVNGIPPKVRLPLVELTVAHLQQRPGVECQQLFKNLSGIIRFNGRWQLPEWSLYLVLWYRLQSVVSPTAAPQEHYASLEPIWADCVRLLAAIAQWGQTNSDSIIYTFRSGVSRLPGASQLEIPNQLPDLNLNELRKSLDRIRQAAPKLKQAIADACAYTAWLDNKISVPESDLLRTILIALDCPFPSFLKVN